MPVVPVVVTDAATAITDTSAQLNGTITPNPDGASGGGLGFFRYDTVDPGTGNNTSGTRLPASGATSLGTGTSPVSYGLTVESPLTPGTLYYFWAIGLNNVDFAYGDVESFTTDDPPATYTIELAVGDYAISGNDLHIDYSGEPDYTVSLTAGVYSITGNPIEIVSATYRITLEAGSYSLAGSDIEILKPTYYIQLANGEYSISGLSIGIIKAWKIYLTAGLYAIAGKALNSIFHNASEQFTLSFLTTLLPAISANTVTYHPRLTVDGRVLPIISWTFREEAQSLSGMLDVQLLRETDRVYILKDSDITLELGTETGGVTTWEALVDTGQLDRTDYHISREGIGPNDSFTMTVKPLLLKRLQTTALNGIVLYDPQKHEIDEANWPVIASTTGDAYAPTFAQQSSLTFYQVLNAAAVSICGFTSVRTNIPNFYVGMAQFQAGQPVMNVIGGEIGMFDPDFSTNEDGTELYVRDGTTGIVEGLPEPRQIGVSNARQMDIATNHNRVDAMLITYLADNRTYDSTDTRVDSETAESGEGESFTRVITTKTFVDFYRASQPGVPVRTEHISTDVSTYQQVKLWPTTTVTPPFVTPTWSLELTQTSSEGFSYNDRGLFAGRSKQEFTRLPVPDAENEFSIDFVLTLDEVETLSYFTHPFRPMRVYCAKHVIQTNGLMFIDTDEPQLEQPYANAAVKVVKSGNAKDGMFSYFGSMRTVIETGTPLRNGKVRFRTIEIDQATGTVNSHFEEERDGDLGTPSHVQEPRQAYVLLTDDAVRTTDPIEELQTGEIGVYLAVALARRKLIQANIYPNLLTMDYIGIDTSLAKGSPINARGRNNEDLGNYIIEARTMQGSRDGHSMTFQVRQA